MTGTANVRGPTDMPTTNFLRLLLAVFLGFTVPGALTAAPAADSELSGLTIKAQQGNAIAQYNLGLAYAEGQGVAKDPMEAFVWLSIALENGARGRALDGVIARLSSAELARGRQLLAQRRAALGLIPAPVATVAPTTTPDTSKAVDAAEQLRRERDALSTKITELVGEIAALRDERDRSQSLAAQSKQDAAAARLLSDAVQSSAQAAASRTIELQQQIEQLQVEAAKPPAYPDLRERVASLEAEIATVLATPPPFADQRELVHSLEAQLAAARQQVSTSEKRLAVFTEAKNGVDSELQTVRAQLTLSQQQADAAQELARSAETRIAALQQQVAQAQAEAAQQPATPAYPDLRERVSDLEAQVGALRDAPPAFSDQRAQVQDLEAQLANALQQVSTGASRIAALTTVQSGTDSELQIMRAQLTSSQQQAEAAQAAADKLLAENRLLAAAAAPREAPVPAYPDLRDRVADLEGQLANTATSPTHPNPQPQIAELEAALATTRAELDAARSAATVAPLAAAPAPDITNKLEETEARLAISLRAFGQLQREHDELLGRVNQGANEKSTERDTLTAPLNTAEAAAADAQAEVARLSETLAALQRSGSQIGAEAASLRALLTQVQGANDLLARENYGLKTARAPAPVAVATPAAPAGRSHTVEPADTLSLISNRYYGTPGRWQEIFNANRDVIDAQGTLRVGMKLRIP